MPVSSRAAPFQSWRYVLPFPPSINKYWLHTRTGHTYISKEGTAFRKKVLQLVQERPNTRRRLAVKIELVAPNERERDVDNYCKGLFDALQHARVYQKDSQIDDLHIVRGNVISPGSCIVEVKEIGYARTKFSAG